MTEASDNGCWSTIEFVETLTERQVEQLWSLMREQWWGTERTLDDVRSMLANTSLSLAAVDRDSGQLMGYARVLTDFVFRATIYDVMGCRRGTQEKDGRGEHR